MCIYVYIRVNRILCITYICKYEQPSSHVPTTPIPQPAPHHISSATSTTPKGPQGGEGGEPIPPPKQVGCKTHPPRGGREPFDHTNHITTI